MTYYHIILPLLFLVTRITGMHGEDWVWCFAKADVGFCEHLNRSVYFKPGFHAYPHSWLEKSFLCIHTDFISIYCWFKSMTKNHSRMSWTKSC